MTDHVVIQHEEATRIIKMRRPDKKNAPTQDMYFAISHAIDSAQNDPAIRCMIITGSSGVFTAGNDLKDFLAAGSSTDSRRSEHRAVRHFSTRSTNRRKPLRRSRDFSGARPADNV
jgi:enoyl-CoA hydratase/carnithine racemase